MTSNLFLKSATYGTRKRNLLVSYLTRRVWRFQSHHCDDGLASCDRSSCFAIPLNFRTTRRELWCVEESQWAPLTFMENEQTKQRCALTLFRLYSSMARKAESVSFTKISSLLSFAFRLLSPYEVPVHSAAIFTLAPLRPSVESRPPNYIFLLLFFLYLFDIHLQCTIHFTCVRYVVR